MSSTSVHQTPVSKPIHDDIARGVTFANSCLNDPNRNPDFRLAILVLLAEEVEKVYPQVTELAN